jgi:hypothetical protein
MMATLLIEPRDSAELHLVRTILKKMKIPTVVLAAHEDLAFGTIIQETDRSKKISRKRIMKKLH